MKKILSFVMVTLLLVGCSQTSSSSINVYTRDSSSGTRLAFEELVDFEGKLTSSALEVSGNGDMASKVGKDATGIGYVSLTTNFEKNNLKALKYNGVEATKENVLNNSYTLARDFNYVTRADNDFESDKKQQLVEAYIAYLTKSIEGMDAISSAGGIVDSTNAKPWSEVSKDFPILQEDNSDITIKLGGSTSVEKTITAVNDTFAPMAGNVNFEVNLTGSGDGYKRVLGSEKDSANQADIGFASRAFKSEEDVTKGLVSGTYAKDAIVVVVSKDNTYLDDISTQTTKSIFTGEILDYSQIK